MDKSEANCRQMVRRARQHLSERRPRYDVSPAQRDRLAQQFMRTCASGDMQSMLALLTEDIVLYSDGGGKTQAARNPVAGREKVARFVLGLASKAPPGTISRRAEINGEPGMIVYLEGKPVAVWTLEFGPERIRGIRVVVNPDKLKGLPPLA